MENEIKNRVAESELITFDLEQFYPIEQKAEFDLKPFLFQGLILKEKDYREALKQHAWEQYSGKIISIHCSADAIIPVWAFMLAGVYLEPVAAAVFYCQPEQIDDFYFQKKILELNLESFTGQRIIIKGCSDKPVPASAYVHLTERLRPVAKSLMYGEACSNVPLYKQKNQS